MYVTIEPVQNELHVLDATTLRTLARIPLPIPPSSGLAFDPSAELLYVGGKSGINVVQLQTNTIVATIPTAGTASHLIVNPESGEIIATVHLGLPGRSQLLVVDPRDRSQTAVTVEGIPSGIALSHQLLLVATFDRSIGAAGATGTGRLLIFHTGGRNILASIPLGQVGCLTSVAALLNGTRAYIGDGCENTILVVDLGLNRVISKIKSSGLNILALNPGGMRLYVARTGEVAVFDTATNEFIAAVRP